jgi:putative ABC transport system permease protein
MRFLTDVYEGLAVSFRALRMNKMRAVLTALGILIGVTTVVLMVTIIIGLNKAVAGQFTFLGSNTLYVSKFNWFSDGDWRQQMKRPSLKPEFVDRIRHDATLADAVSPFGQTMRSIAFRDNRLSRIQVMGVNQDYLVTNSVKLDLGRFLSEDDVKRNRQVAVIGAGISEKLFDKEGPLDKRVDIGGQKFRVIGVNAKMGNFFGQNMDDFVYVPIGAFVKRFGKDEDLNQMLDIVVKAKSPEVVNDLEWELRGIMRRIHRLRPTQPDDFGINSQSMIMNIYKSVTASIYTGGVLIAAISLLVGGIGIMNIMLVSVTERTSEVGLRKALGAHRWMIAWQFLVESAVICAIGGLLGVALAYVGGKVMNNFIPVSMPWWVVGFGIGFSAIVGVFFGLYPSMKAARLSPIEALRQE